MSALSFQGVLVTTKEKPPQHQRDDDAGKEEIPIILV
jgi:hypothetical protein